MPEAASTLCAAVAIVVTTACIGCRDGDDAPADPPAPRQVQGSLNLQRSEAGARGGHGPDRYRVRAAGGLARITGRVEPASASIAVSDRAGSRTARVNIAPDGTFDAVLAPVRRRKVTFGLTATAGNARPWEAEIVASRGDAGGSAGADVRVPARDDSPPTAIMLLRSGGRVVSSISPVRHDDEDRIRLSRPALALTALVRDRDGGTGRVRASVTFERICLDPDTGMTTIRRTPLHFPPSEIARVKLPPGATAPVERRRRARVGLDRSPDCVVRGKAWADATNASGLESFSDPIRFRFGGP